MLIENNILLISLDDIEDAGRGAYVQGDGELEAFCDLLHEKAEILTDGVPEQAEDDNHIPFIDMPFSKTFLERMMSAIQAQKQARAAEEDALSRLPRSRRKKDYDAQAQDLPVVSRRPMKFKLVVND